MGTTPNRSYPYPDPTDPADFPQGMQDLAEAVDLDVQALVDSVARVPLCVVTNDVPQNGLSGFPATLTYTTVDYDNDSMANLAVDNAGITPPTAGLYFIHASVRCIDTSTQLEMFLRTGLGTGTDFGRTIHQGDAPGQPRLVVSGLASLSGTTRVWATIQHNSGATKLFYTARLVALRVA